MFSQLKSVLFVIFVGGVSYFAYQDYQQGLIQNKKQEYEDYLFPELDFKKIKIFKISNIKTAIVAKKNNQRWSQVAPVKDVIDETLLEKFSSKIFGMIVEPLEDITLDKSNLEKYGLREPILNIQFVTEDNQLHIVRVGKNSFDGRFYLTKDNGQLYLGEAVWKKLSDFYADDFRLKNIYKNNQPITELEISSPLSRITLVKKANWELKEHPELQVDPIFVDEMISKLQSTRLKVIISDDPKDLKEMKLEPAAGSISVKHRDNTTAQILFSKQYGTNVFSYLKSRGLIVSLAYNFYDEWALTPFDFTDRRSMFNFDRTAVYQLNLTDNKKQLKAFRKANTWENQSGDFKLNIRTLESLANSIQNLRILSRVNLKKLDYTSRIEILNKQSKSVLVLKSALIKGKLYVHSSLAPEQLFTIDKKHIKLFDINTYQKKKL